MAGDTFTIRRDDLGRFVRGQVDVCYTRNELDEVIGVAQNWQLLMWQVDQALVGVEQLLVDTPEYQGYVRAERLAIRDEWQRLDDLSRDVFLKHARDGDDEYEGPAFVFSREIEVIDVTGLEGREASTLALKLKRWNPEARQVYSFRQGRRYLSPQISAINLNDPVIKAMPFHDDLLDIVQEKRIPIVFEEVR